MSATIRKLLIPVFRRVNLGDITIHHHWTGDKFHLHTFTHKGYWFHGRSRNRNILEQVRSVVASGDCVFDLGGHIGYTAVYFSWLTGPSGHVYVFEPSPDNLIYLWKNVELSSRRNITVVESAVSDRMGPCILYSDGITGQNSTIVPEFYRRHLAAGSTTFAVRATTIDDFVEQNDIRPGFIKVDAEGAEAQILRGMKTTLRDAKPRLMIETSLNLSDVWNLLAAADYRLYAASGQRIDGPAQLTAISYMFAFHASDADAPVRLQLRKRH